jgi:tRNA threonylcarbamoyladenosine biosynthesis protein TsaE
LKEECVTYISGSDEETVTLGKRLGRLLGAGDVIALVGELGSGKTWFTKGLALGLEISEENVVTSPSFALLNTYAGRETLFHIDAYRLETLDAFLSAGLDECFYEDGVVAMEWADLWPEILPAHHVKVELTIVDEGTRNITLSASHPRGQDILETLRSEEG